MRATFCGSVTMAVLMGLMVALVFATVTEAAVISMGAQNASVVDEESLDHESYSPYKGVRSDEFDWSLCRNLARKYAGNMLISPISVKLALVLLYEGAEGQTRHELGGALQLPERVATLRDRYSSVISSLQAKNPEYTLDISTRLFVDTSINPNQGYTSVIKSFYATDVTIANLTDSRKALKDINDWVSNVTHGRVKEVLTDEEKLKDSIFLVLNAMFFRGTWRQPFLRSTTRYGNFFTDVNKPVEVSYMNNVGRYYHAFAPELDAQILRLPYRGHKYSMFIVLPEARTGLNQLLSEFNPFLLRQRMQEMEEVPVDVSIPKFKVEFTTHLENTLRELGIRDIFDNTASLIYIARAKQWGQRLQVSDFVQKAGLEVDEVGTTAHVVTEVVIGNKISDRAFHARHPFLFFIEDETTGTILFVGKVTNPLESSGSIEEPLPTPTRFANQPSAAAPLAAAAGAPAAPASAPAPAAGKSNG